MRIPKKEARTPSADRASKPATTPSEASTERLAPTTTPGRIPWTLSDAIADTPFASTPPEPGSKRPAPPRRTTARVQRAFADAFLDESMSPQDTDRSTKR